MRLILALLLATLLASAVLAALPGIDLAAAGAFYNGRVFPIAANRSVEAVRVALYWIEDLGFLVTLALALRGRPFLNLSGKDWLFQMLVYLLGPGLIVNAILKPFWGRARPFQVTSFGGSAPFSRAWAISDHCCGNTSFVSGEMAGATALAISLIMILRANRPRLGDSFYRMGIFAVLLLPLWTAWQRMAAGKHFFSDIVVSALLVCLLAAVLRRLLPRKAAPQPVLTSQLIPPISRLP